MLWLKPDFVVWWSFIGAGRRWASVPAPAVVQGVSTVLQLAMEWNGAGGENFLLLLQTLCVCYVLTL